MIIHLYLKQLSVMTADGRQALLHSELLLLKLALETNLFTDYTLWNLLITSYEIFYKLTRGKKSSLLTLTLSLLTRLIIYFCSPNI